MCARYNARIIIIIIMISLLTKNYADVLVMKLLLLLLLLGDDEPPLNLAADAAGRGTGCLCREDDRVADGPCVEICGHPYEFDNVTDFGSILQPSVVTGNDVLLVCV